MQSKQCPKVQKNNHQLPHLQNFHIFLYQLKKSPTSQLLLSQEIKELSLSIIQWLLSLFSLQRYPVKHHKDLLYTNLEVLQSMCKSSITKRKLWYSNSRLCVLCQSVKIRICKNDFTTYWHSHKHMQSTWWCVLSNILQLEWISWTWERALKKFSFRSSSLSALICNEKSHCCWSYARKIPEPLWHIKQIS